MPDNNITIKTNPIGKIIETDIVSEMKKSYLDYAMSVIVSRALPDVRDGLKPVHRRILYAMNQMNLTPGGRFSKSAKVVGEVLGKYHPHGDMSVYMAMVRMAQEFSLRYPLVKGQGNFGSIDGDPPAAMRYTEAKMAKISNEMIEDINKETVDTVDNFDSTLQEPTVLPAKIPNLLLNGADGIAVGMATKIPPHNLKEICEAIDFILKNCHLEKKSKNLNDIKNLLPKNPTTKDLVLKDVYELENQKFLLETKSTVDELTQFVKGPDFPTAGIIYGKNGIIDMYKTGRGKFTIRGKTDIEETKNKHRIIITQLPYQVNKADLVQKIAQLVRDKKITGISDLRDESDRRGIRVVIEIKKTGRPNSILNKIYKLTPLQSYYSSNIIALVNGTPQTLNLRQMLLLFLRHRENIIRKRTIFDLKNAALRSHILEGLKIAIDNLDAIIKTIRSSSTVEKAKENLITKFELTDLQAIAILEMQLRRLAALERQKIENEYKEIQETINELTEIITKADKMVSVLKKENKEIKEKYSDPRKSKIFVKNLEDFNEEDLIPNEKTLVTTTKTGYIKRVSKSTYKAQRRGGKGIVGMATKEEDEIDTIMSVNTHDDLLFFTNKGKVFKIKVWELTESTRQAKGQAVINLININQEEKIQAILPISQKKDHKYIILATKKGIIKKTHINQFKNIRQNGLIAIKLDPDDQLCWAQTTNGNNQVFMVTHNGKCIRFDETDARPMGRHTRGVRGILLKDSDHLVSMDTIPLEAIKSKNRKKVYRDILVVTENGMGKRSSIYLYPKQKRGGVGVKVANLSTRTGKIAKAQVISQDHESVILISKKAVTIKLPLRNIPQLGRNTKGVILMRFKTKNDQVSTMTILLKPTEMKKKLNK
ncbi:DNA gyrase subunit A [Patescibacteria group bacterium]|nr:DNA gyrase subunit A [Patescibacteria group bacterium]